jgi:glycosyltransferase involved in cell wall biosynthesis
VARQYPQKGHVHLLAAADLLAVDHPGLVLLLAGPEGPATPAIRAARSAMVHPEVVRDLGDRSDVADLLAAADVFVLSSLAEGAAGAVIEAMSVGTPVVCTRLEGLDGVLRDGHDALLARPGDAPDLARALATTLDDPGAAEDRAARARQEFLDRFTLEAAADGMAALYRDLASGQF